MKKPARLMLLVLLLLLCVAMISACGSTEGSALENYSKDSEIRKKCELVFAEGITFKTEAAQFIEYLFEKIINKDEIGEMDQFSTAVCERWDSYELDADYPVSIQKVVYQDDLTYSVLFCQRNGPVSSVGTSEIRWGILEIVKEQTGWALAHLIITDDVTDSSFWRESEELIGMLTEYLKKTRKRDPLTEEDIMLAKKAAVSRQLADSYTFNLSEEEIVFLRKNIVAVYNKEWEGKYLSELLYSDSGILSADYGLSANDKIVLIACIPTDDLKQNHPELMQSLPVSDEKRGFACLAKYVNGEWTAVQCVFSPVELEQPTPEP